MLRIGRREFITLVGGAAAWPLEARAQQTAVPLIGYLFRGSREPNPGLVEGFRRGLSEVGFYEGRNVKIEYRFAEGETDRLPGLAADLVRRGAAVIAAPGGTTTVLAAKKATTTVPIVFEIGSDPVADGLVASFNRPGGNLTGVTAINAELSGKRLGLLSGVVPRATRVGLVTEPGGALTISGTPYLRDIQNAAATVGWQIEVLYAGTNSQVDQVFASLSEKQIDAILVSGSPVLYSLRAQLVSAAARHAVPAIYPSAAFAEAGGLMSYGANDQDDFRLVGVYVGRILKGEKPADLPVLRPTKFDFILNLKTARALDLNIPPTLRALADEVID